jgi:L-rhamnose mutarotase
MLFGILENIKLKVLDGDVDYRSPNFQQYYNCSSLGRLDHCELKNDKIYLDNKPMRCYHVAWGHGVKARMPQLFSQEICDWFCKKLNEK